MTMLYFSIITVLQLQQQHIWSEAPVETKRVLPSTSMFHLLNVTKIL